MSDSISIGYAHHNGLRIKDLLNFVTNQIVDRLHIQFGSQPLLYAVDDGEFSGAVFSDFKQALGLIEETCIFKRHTHAVGKRLQQAHIRFAEGMLAPHIHQVY